MSAINTVCQTKKWMSRTKVTVFQIVLAVPMAVNWWWRTDKLWLVSRELSFSSPRDAGVQPHSSRKWKRGQDRSRKQQTHTYSHLVTLSITQHTHTHTHAHTHTCKHTAVPCFSLVLFMVERPVNSWWDKQRKERCCILYLRVYFHSVNLRGDSGGCVLSGMTYCCLLIDLWFEYLKK